MSKSTELSATSDIVKDILQRDPKARNSDSYLLSMTYSTIAKERGIDLDHMPVLVFFLKLGEYGFPSPETIRRARQKLQACNPELAASENVESARMVNEDAFKDYARKVCV